jgi:hypothetical protein
LDSHVLALLIPILALSIPVVAVVMKGLQRLAQTRLEETRIRATAMGGDEGEIAGLRAEVDELRRELSEVQERVDFTERLLSQPREPSRPPNPNP